MSDLTGQRCPVCMDDLPCDFVARCGHGAHRVCLQPNLRAGAYSCPVCRAALGDEPVEADQPLLKRYVRMRQQQIPVGAVRQRMEADGVSAAVIDAFFSGGASELLQDSAAPSVKSSIDTSKFAKMLTLGIGEGAVRQKMVASGISNEDINTFFGDLINTTGKS